MKCNLIIYGLYITLAFSGWSNDSQAATILKTSSAVAEQKETVKREVDPKIYSYGRRLFLKNCAACHGKNAEGDKNWRKLNDQGKYPPPPLNGTGHTWHHSIKALTNVIKNGTGKIGGNMPAWKDRLSDKDITAILVYIQAQWSDEIYTAWYNNLHKEK